MAFGITRDELIAWKRKVKSGEIAYLTHYWIHPKFPSSKTVTKVGCNDLDKLEQWVISQQLNPAYIHRRDKYPHFDLIGPMQKEILAKEQLWHHIQRFKL